MGELDMKPVCEALETLLAAGPDRIEDVERHCRTCAECRAGLEELEAISETARTLRTTWSSPELWPRIERALADRAAVPSADEAPTPFPSRPDRPRVRPMYWQMAAALVLLALLTGVAVLLHRPRRSENDWMVRAAAIDSVETAERAHVQAIDRLAEVAAPQLDAPATPLLVSYKEKLLLLDDAIAECRTGIASNKYNAHLRRELLAMYVAKQRTLEEVVNGEGHAEQSRR
jgi:hypothetical protein